jgi:hypothetical protein
MNVQFIKLYTSFVKTVQGNIRRHNDKATPLHHTKVQREVEVQLHSFLDPSLDGGEWSALVWDRLTPMERAPHTR